MAVHDSGGAAAGSPSHINRRVIKTQEAEVFLSCQEYFLFLDHVETVRMFTVSALSQACRPVSVARIQCLLGPGLNDPPYFLGEPTTLLGLSGEP